MTPQEDNRLHQIKKNTERFNFGKTIEIAANMKFLVELCERMIAENKKLTAENMELRGKAHK